jgi:hypothetical protein
VNAALDAPHVAVTFAVTFPTELTAIPETVTPFKVALAPPLKVTDKLLSTSSVSLTDAIVNEPLESPATVCPKTAIVGAVLARPPHDGSESAQEALVIAVRFDPSRFIT